MGLGSFLIDKVVEKAAGAAAITAITTTAIVTDGVVETVGTVIDGVKSKRASNRQNALRERIIQLEKENKALKDSGAFASLNEETDKGIPKLSQYKLSLHFTENRMVYYTGMPPAKEMNIELDLEQIFKFISVRISGTIDDKRFIKELSEYVEGFDVDKQQALIVKNQLITLGLLEEVEIGLFVNVRLSQLGKRVMKHLNAPEKR